MVSVSISLIRNVVLGLSASALVACGGGADASDGSEATADAIVGVTDLASLESTLGLVLDTTTPSGTPFKGACYDALKTDATAANDKGSRGTDSAGGATSKVFSAGSILGERSGGGACLAFSSNSILSISVSSWLLNSLLAFLNSPKALPNWRPNSGSFLGPKMTRASRKMKIISGMPRFMNSS